MSSATTRATREAVILLKEKPSLPLGAVAELAAQRQPALDTAAAALSATLSTDAAASVPAAVVLYLSENHPSQGLDCEVEPAAVKRVLEWLTANPWELRKARSARKAVAAAAQLFFGRVQAEPMAEQELARSVKAALVANGSLRRTIAVCSDVGWCSMTDEAALIAAMRAALPQELRAEAKCTAAWTDYGGWRLRVAAARSLAEGDAALAGLQAALDAGCAVAAAAAALEAERADSRRAAAAERRAARAAASASPSAGRPHAAREAMCAEDEITEKLLSRSVWRAYRYSRRARACRRFDRPERAARREAACGRAVRLVREQAVRARASARDAKAEACRW